MDEVMREYKTCPECNHPWVSSHFQDGTPCLCVECGCHWAVTIKAFHSLANDMKNREGKPPQMVGSPAVERARIEGKARKPFNVERFWVWVIMGIFILFMCIKLTGKDEARLPIEQTIEEREVMEKLDQLIYLIEEGRYDEIPDLVPLHK